MVQRRVMNDDSFANQVIEEIKEDLNTSQKESNKENIKLDSP